MIGARAVPGSQHGHRRRRCGINRVILRGRGCCEPGTARAPRLMLCFSSFSRDGSLVFGTFPLRSIPANSPSNRMDIMIMRTFLTTIAGLLFFTFNSFAASPDFEQLKAEAEKQYADGSYALAHETYVK